MSDQFSPIRPKQVPLSHGTPAEEAATTRGPSVVTWALGVALLTGLLVLVFFVVPSWLDKARQVSTAQDALTARPEATAPASSVPSAGADTASKDDALPPYQQLLRQQAREKAQKELAEFVKLQIELEKKMHVGAWGQDEYTAAKNLAADGDAQFVKEDFEQSIASYHQAAAKLADLIRHGKEILEASLSKGEAALTARDKPSADKAFALAEAIAPEDPRVAAGKARAALLPQISSLMRQGRNQELTESWDAAARTYEKVKALDPDTSGLGDAVDRVAEGRRQAQVRTLLSRGFDHLDGQRFDQARSAFQQVLKLDPGNAVANGGLEQVAKSSDVARIKALKSQADRAVAQERWADAAALYAKVLEVDSTIQFAQDGHRLAQNQQRTRETLARILQSPERLSSDKLYRDAEQILDQAEKLEPKGPKLASQIEDVRKTLDTYGHPVPVILRSDNRTEVILSTVGSLGSFEEKHLELRPGAYTVIGSRDGCRDVREQIVVRPNMNPVDIRCVESL